MKGSLLLTLFFYSTLSIASVYDPIGHVAALKGTVVAYGNDGKTVTYLTKGSKIYKKLMLVTRNESGVRISLANGERLILKSNTKITINGPLITLKRGLIKYHDPNGSYETYKFKFQRSDTVYAGRSLIMGDTSKRPFITPLNESEIKITQLSKARKVQDDLRVPDINKLLRPVETSLSPSEEGGDVAESSVESSEDEVLSMFGESDVEDESGTELGDDSDSSRSSEIEDLFSDGGGSSTVDDSAREVEAELPIDFDPDGAAELHDLLDINWKLGMYLTGYISKPVESSRIDDQFAHGDFKLSFNDKVNISDDFNFFHSGWFEIGNRKRVRDDSVLSFSGREVKKPILMINEFYWLKSMDKLDFTIGKKVVRLGKGMIVSPVDKLSPTDSIIPSNPERLGIYMTSLDYYLGDSKFTLLWVPYINTGKSPDPLSRWSTRTTGDDFTVESIYPSGFGTSSTQTLLKFETTFKGFDIFAAMFNGANPDPIITNNITKNGNTPEFVIQQEFVHVTNFSTGFSTTFGGLEIHGEVLYQNAAEGKDDSYNQYLLGYRYSFDEWPTKFGLQQIDVIMEYQKETIRNRVSYPFILLSSISSRIFRNNLIGTFNFQVSDKLSYNLGFNIDQESSGSAYLLGMGYRMANGGQLTVRYEAFSGEDKEDDSLESIFKKWENNDNLALEFTKDF